ncbi:ribosomal export protein NMD3 [Seminavis robusta]|uniref:60S ribosomal export protein NMD3 n=1 Tax=Seminavis robusta TaxID=568900 RepID=A0A9N8DC39_9STRA|nr:ribosomal export protein NMD3 [Seminavis robusta]|eukprot:Sro84_g044850.1 ribosomal export protein NMD3 (583) ;mRNA; f:64820-66568
MAASTNNPAGSTMVKVLCCVCGIPIDPNAANTCASCLASTSDITRGISTEVHLHQCRGCRRWHRGAGKWMGCDLESRELMSLCLANISGLKAKSKADKGVRLVDASWIWTEPHSMRLKVRLAVQKEVQAGTILQQSFLVEFIVRNQQCVDCAAEFRQGTWKSLVQVRQRVGHKRTFLYLEQLILKHGAHRGCLSIEAFKDGMDFYFPDKGKAARFICFLENVVPIKTKCSKKLIGTDDKSNVSNFKYTNLVEICTLCKDDLLYLPAKTARNMGNISQLVLVKNISNLIHFIDPLSGQTASMNAEQYWRDPLRPIITAARSRMTRFVVLGKEPVVLRRNVSKRTTSKKQKSKLAELTLAKEDDLGVNDVQYQDRSHVGYLMKSGDVAAGYDLKQAQFVHDEAEELRQAGKLPDVVVIRKLYGGEKRLWQLKRLDVDVTETALSLKARAAKNQEEADHMDEEDFMQEVEADKEMRQNMNLYKSAVVPQQPKNDEDDDEDDDDQQIRLEELLDALALDAGPDDEMEDAEGEDGNLAPGEYEEGEKAAKDGIKYIDREAARGIKEKDVAVPVTGGTFDKELDFDDL